MRNGVRLFVSYAERNQKLVQDLLGRLRPHFAISRSHAYETWEFHDLLVGEDWHARIQTEIAASEVGMLCLSPDFFASNYIIENELLQIVREKKVIPVGLMPIDFKLHDLHSIEKLQIFRLRTARGDLRFYFELQTKQKEAFALELFRAVEMRLAHS